MKTKPVGKKKERAGDLRYFEMMLKSFNFYHDSKRIELIKEKSYLEEKFKAPPKNALNLSILKRYGISDRKTTDKEIKKFLATENQTIYDCITMFKAALNYMEILFKDKRFPKARMWFVDVFGESSVKYLPDWKQQKRKSSNKPNFPKSYELFKEFMMGATPAELGFVFTKYIDTAVITGIVHRETRRKSKYHRLRYDYFMQGAIMFLWDTHQILYKQIDDERALERDKVNKIKEILSDLPERHAQKIISHVKYSYDKKLPRRFLTPHTINMEKDPIY